jgi:hypothetical protein
MNGYQNIMKAIGSDLALALTFAALAVVAILIGQKGENPYFIIAAAAFAVATYVMYPPSWAVQLVKMLPGRRNERK